MSINFRSQDPNASRGERYLQLVMSGLHVVLAGMLVYFRFGPAARVLSQLRARGLEIPAWLPLTMTVGVLAVAGFLALRGLRSFRRFRGDTDPEDGP